MNIHGGEEEIVVVMMTMCVQVLAVNHLPRTDRGWMGDGKCDPMV